MRSFSVDHPCLIFELVELSPMDRFNSCHIVVPFLHCLWTRGCLQISCNPLYSIPVSYVHPPASFLDAWPWQGDFQQQRLTYVQASQPYKQSKGVEYQISWIIYRDRRNLSVADLWRSFSIVCAAWALSNRRSIAEGNHKCKPKPNHHLAARPGEGRCGPSSPFHQ